MAPLKMIWNLCELALMLNDFFDFAFLDNENWLDHKIGAPSRIRTCTVCALNALPSTSWAIGAFEIGTAHGIEPKSNQGYHACNILK